MPRLWLQEWKNNNNNHIINKLILIILAEWSKRHAVELYHAFQPKTSMQKTMVFLDQDFIGKAARKNAVQAF